MKILIVHLYIQTALKGNSINLPLTPSIRKALLSAIEETNKESLGAHMLRPRRCIVATVTYGSYGSKNTLLDGLIIFH